MPSTPLGAYLRSRRALVDPEDLAVPVHGVRRVAGLRREEVATAAGMSVDYYIRLEQGRERHPSVPILEALCRVLRIDHDGRLHLFRLAGLAPGLAPDGAVEAVDPILLQMMCQWSDTPAILLGRAFDVLALNPIADVLFDGFGPTRNLAASMFLDPAARTFYADWERAARYTVAGLRLAEGASPEHPRLRQVIEELRARSADFEQMWQRNDARGKRLESKGFVHPQVGPLTLQLHAFDVRATPGQELVVYTAEPASPSAQALALLGALAADRAALAASADEPTVRGMV